MTNDTTQPKAPREGSETLAGLPWLPRMIDKARLDAQGVIHVFDLDYQCPMDQRLLGQLLISGERFQQVVLENDTDQAIVEALKAEGCVL